MSSNTYVRMHILMWKQNICIGYHRWGVPSTKKDFENFYPKGCNNRREKNPLNYQMNSCVLLFCAQCTQEFASSFFLSWLSAHPTPIRAVGWSENPGASNNVVGIICPVVEIEFNPQLITDLP